MKYKVGDKVKVKTWKEMKKEYNSSHEGIILMGYFSFYIGMEDWINENFPDRILTIEEVHKNNYYTICDKYKHNWTDEMIEYKIESEIVEPITNRFEILDL